MVAKFFPDILPAVEQYEAGLSLATIAQHLGVHRRACTALVYADEHKHQPASKFAGQVQDTMPSWVSIPS